VASSIGDDDPIIPDVAETALAFRTWRLSDAGKLLSINAPALTGKAGGNPAQLQRKISWIHRALADPEGQDGWPTDQALEAHCGVLGRGAESNEDHGKIPSKNCSCGIYATTSLNVINGYLGNEIIMGTYAIRGPVLGIVEMGGQVIPATQGYRARYARPAAILLIDPVFSLDHALLRRIAETYNIPAITPHSKDPADYREAINELPAIVDPSAVADETEEWLKKLMEEGGEE
jgi:hypothetical protein